MFRKEVLTAIAHQIIYANWLIWTADSRLFFRMCRIRYTRPSARIKLINVRIYIKSMSDKFGVSFYFLSEYTPVAGFLLPHHSPPTAVERIIRSNSPCISPVPCAWIGRITSYSLRFGILCPLLRGYSLCNPLYLPLGKRHFDRCCPTILLANVTCAHGHMAVYASKSSRWQTRSTS